MYAEAQYRLEEAALGETSGGARCRGPTTRSTTITPRSVKKNIHELMPSPRPTT
jgi:hypothetical protein